MTPLVLAATLRPWQPSADGVLAAREASASIHGVRRVLSVQKDLQAGVVCATSRKNFVSFLPIVWNGVVVMIGKGSPLSESVVKW